MALTPKQVEQINDELSQLSDGFQSSGYARLLENERVQLDAYFTKDHLLQALRVIGWID